jgi:hypothetical protein
MPRGEDTREYRMSVLAASGQSDCEKSQKYQAHVVTPPVHFTPSPSGPTFHPGALSTRKTARIFTIEANKEASATYRPTLLTGEHMIYPWNFVDVPNTPSKSKSEGDVITSMRIFRCHLRHVSLGHEPRWVGIFLRIARHRPVRAVVGCLSVPH